MLFKELGDLLAPTLKTWDALKFHNNETKSRMNIAIASKKLIVESNHALDEMIMNSIMYYDNLNCFIAFGKNKVDAYHLYNSTFKDKYILYGIKEITMLKKDVFKLLYQLFFPRFIIKSKEELLRYIETRYSFIHSFADDQEIVFSSLFVCKRFLNEDFPVRDITENSYCVYIPKILDEKIIASSVIYCQTSIDFIKLQNFDYFLTRENERSKKMFLKYKNWLTINIPVEQRSSFMLFSSIVLYLIGNREMTDLDLYIDNVDETTREKVKEFDTNEIFSYIEYKIKGGESEKYWPLHWNTWLDEWARKSGAKYFEEVIACPKFHFYYLGIKVISLNCDIQRRIVRNRPRATADLIALRKRYLIPKFPKIPQPERTKVSYISVVGKSEDEIKVLLSENANSSFDPKNMEIRVETENDINKFLITVAWALKERYRMIFSLNQIREELNMPISSSPSIIVHAPTPASIPKSIIASAVGSADANKSELSYSPPKSILPLVSKVVIEKEEKEEPKKNIINDGSVSIPIVKAKVISEATASATEEPKKKSVKIVIKKVLSTNK